MSTTQKLPIRGAIAFDPAHLNVVSAWSVSTDNPGGAIELAPGEFLLEAWNTGCKQIARFTGRTRQCWGIACPTVERFRIETIARDSAIWGIRADRIPGTLAVRPETVIREA